MQISLIISTQQIKTSYTICSWIEVFRLSIVDSLFFPPLCASLPPASTNCWPMTQSLVPASFPGQSERGSRRVSSQPSLEDSTDRRRDFQFTVPTPLLSSRFSLFHCVCFRACCVGKSTKVDRRKKEKEDEPAGPGGGSVRACVSE